MLRGSGHREGARRGGPGGSRIRCFVPGVAEAAQSKQDVIEALAETKREAWRRFWGQIVTHGGPMVTCAIETML
jgi:hypothetical protein